MGRIRVHQGVRGKQGREESHAARAAAIIRLAIEVKVHASYTAEKVTEDPVTLWKKIVEDRKAVVVVDKNYMITQLHQDRLEDCGSRTAYVDTINTTLTTLQHVARRFMMMTASSI